ncbi:hypothetical protein BH24ACT19_BH24ACT19_08020 [soil metagenome]
MKSIYTGEWPAYKDIATEGTEHKAVRHRRGEYAKGDVHTNILKGASPADGLVHLARLPWRFACLYTSAFKQAFAGG